jgi:hypothetical protein
LPIKGHNEFAFAFLFAKEMTTVKVKPQTTARQIKKPDRKQSGFFICLLDWFD